MEAIENVNITSILDTLISLAAAFLLGALIGLERQYRLAAAPMISQGIMESAHDGVGSRTHYMSEGVSDV